MRALRHVLWMLVVLAALLVLWGLIEPYFYRVEAEEAAVSGLPEQWEGERFAQISDWQIGMWLANAATMARIVEYLVQERPAFVLFSGDFVADVEAHTEDAEEALDTVVELLLPLREAGVPIYGVLGNHDYGMRWQDSRPDLALAEQVRASLERAGVRVLENEAVPLRHPSAAAAGSAPDAQPFYLVGLGAHWPNEDDAELALSEVPNGAARIAMMHHPDTFAALPPTTAPLAVAGHTHGGQIRLPFTPGWSWLTFVRSDEIHADGWIDGDYGAAGNRLYVNRGIGFSTVPLRINAVPEVTLFTLKRAAEGG